LVKSENLILCLKYSFNEIQENFYINFIKLISFPLYFLNSGSGVSFLKHFVRWLLAFTKKDVAITPDPCDGDHHCIMNVNDGKSYFAFIYVNDTLPVVSTINP